MDTDTPEPDRLTPRYADHRIKPRLDREWTMIRRRRTELERVNSWHIVDVGINDLEHLLVLAGARSATTESSERLFRRLVLIARTDELAARIALQRILPGLMSAVRRRRSADGPDQVLEELIGAAWITIRTFDPARRPSCLAAALVRSAEHQAYKSVERRRSSTETTVDPVVLDWHVDEQEPSAIDELAALLRQARASGVDEADLTLVRQLVGHGSPAVLAGELGVTSRTVRNRRDRVMYRMRRVALVA